MSNVKQCKGVVVPMVTPVTASGDLDVEAVERLIEFLVGGGVDGVFVLGTTGEGVSVQRSVRQQLVEMTVARVRGRKKVYAGIGDMHPDDAAIGNGFFQAGVDTLVARPPTAHPPDQLLNWYRSLLDEVSGPVIMYNIPPMTNLSIPLDIVGELVGHPRLVGIKDSENNEARLNELMRRFGGRPDFSVFVGVGALMAKGLRLGADGIVPSVGNLIPEVCGAMYAAALRQDWSEMQQHADRMLAVASVYQKGRTLGESLAALKAALHVRGLCPPNMLPPLVPVPDAELSPLRNQLAGLNLLV